MQSENWQKIKAVFNEVVELDALQQTAYLESLDDETLRREVENLIAADADAKTMADLFAREDSTNLSLTQSFIDRQIGNYRIVRELGFGGMGAVYLAERDDLKNRVALKILKHEFASVVLFNRFQNEREILAALEHPNIARLLDSGTTAEGTPYFVMEYVAGADLLTFCLVNNLSFDERLKLFRKVCAAVAYAHSRLVVHRDLKPSNILVTEMGEPKLLDFGISKLISESETAPEKGTVTSFGMLTPNYASPEQFRGETVSTATDIYSLGVILYELLTDALPYQIMNKRLDEVARAICETEPERPSSVISDLGFRISDLRKTGENKEERTKDGKLKTNPKSQIPNPKSLRGDLDNILLKALRKEPSRRYSSVEKFSEDLRRHLEGLPVTARPDTFSYRAEKFIKRNRVSVAVAALVFLLLLGGIVGVSSQYIRAERQRVLAEKRFGEVRQMANNVVFKYYDEANKLAGSTKMREMMVKDAVSYLDGLANDAANDESLQREIGLAYIRIAKAQGLAYFANLGDTSGAIENYKKGIALLEPLITKSNDTKFQWDFVNSLSDLSGALRRQGNITESDDYLNRARELNEKYLAANPEDPTLLARSAYSYYFIGDTLPVGSGEHENIAAYRKSAAIAEKILSRAPNHPRANNIYAADIQRIGYFLLALSRNASEMNDAPTADRLRDEAIAYYRRAVELGVKMVGLFPNDQLYEGILSAAKNNESEYLIETSEYEKALQITLEALRNYESKANADPENLENKLNLTYIYATLNTIHLRLKNSSKARESYMTMTALFDELTARDAENLDYRQKRLQAVYLYADELLKTGKIEEAGKIYTEEFAAAEAKFQERNPSFAVSLRGTMFEKTGDCEAARLKNNPPPDAKNEIIKKARMNYEQALSLWQQSGGAQIAQGVSDADRIKIVKYKLAALSEPTA